MLLIKTIQQLNIMNLFFVESPISLIKTNKNGISFFMKVIFFFLKYSASSIQNFKLLFIFKNLSYKQLFQYMFINDDDPFRLTGHEQSYKINLINENSTLHSNNKSLQKGTINFDTSFTDFTLTISKCLSKSPYPENKALFNPFCPLCSKFVSKTDNFTLCQIKNFQLYLIHDKCLLSNPSFQMNLIADQEDNLFLLKSQRNNEKSSCSIKSRNLALQCRQFLIEIIFYHPISEKKFGKVQKKHKSSIENNAFIEINLFDMECVDEYSPNMIVLPLTDYQLEVLIQQIGEGTKQKISKYINFKKLSSSNGKSLAFGNEEIQFDLKILDSEQQKQQIIQKMNYKYAFPVNKGSILVVQRLLFQLPQEFKESDSEQYDEIMESRSSKLLQYLQIDSKIEDFKSQTSRKSSQGNNSHEQVKNKRSTQNKMFSNKIESNDSDRVNLQKLIKTDSLKQFVKNNTQSRSFQSFLQKANPQQIDKIIEHMRQHFVQLMKHQYGNYMMQKLFSVCNLERRIVILELLIPLLSDIVMNKQGTHAFQQFLSFFTNDQQYLLVLNKIRQNFYELCTHNNATHFVQKIIKQFPIQLLNQFYYYCVQNLYQFGCDKNGMCVIKHMLKKLKQISQRSFDLNNNQQILKMVQQYKKWFVQATLFTLDAIIGDMYGNYVVQFNFQLFEPSITYSLTDSILMKLPQYSLSKYSTNVVFKCLNAYWIDRKDYVSSVLKQVFQPYLILQMYKNKDGNKILLELMQKYEGYQIWNKIYNILISTQPTRFYHDRWGVCLGCRSGNVGGNWSSFSDALQKMGSKKKNSKYI